MPNQGFNTRRGDLQDGREPPPPSPPDSPYPDQVAGAQTPEALSLRIDSRDWPGCSSPCLSRMTAKRLGQKGPDVLRSSGVRKLCLPSGSMYMSQPRKN